MDLFRELGMSSDIRDSDVMDDVKFKQGKLIGDWKIEKMLDYGEYGMVYNVTNVKDNRIAALKAESNSLEGGSAIKLEALVLRKVNKSGPTPHVPEIFFVAKRTLYCYLVMTLLGPDLKTLKKKYGVMKEGFSKGTWSRIGIQCLYAIKLLHDHGFVHRHIKPRNFLLGSPSDKQRARIVHIIDFGLARQFAFYDEREKKWIARRARRTVLFRGALRYSSPNVHQNKEQGRVDDLWSLFYMLIELVADLEWQNETDPVKVETMKTRIRAHLTRIFMPSYIGQLPTVLSKYDHYQRPDYHHFFYVLWMFMRDAGVESWAKYDWETEEPDKSLPPAAWEDHRGVFFDADPLGINEPPPLSQNVTQEGSKDDSGAVKKVVKKRKTNELK